MKVVINRCWGGFSLSREAVLYARELSGNKKWGGSCIKGDRSSNGCVLAEDYGYVECDRHDEFLVKAVEELGSKESSGSMAELKIVEIPDGIEYYIDDYDGMESVHEKHHSWS